MRYFVTGATGYIGHSLAHRLARDGHKVFALVRSRNKTSLLMHPNIIPVEGDLFDLRALNPQLNDIDGIFHLAALARVWSKDPSMYFKINVGAVIDVLELAKEIGARRVVFTSSAGVLGPSSGIDTTEESYRVVDFFNEYESSKFIAEERFFRHNCQGVERVVVEPTRVYGPGIESDSNAVTRMITGYVSGRWRLVPGDGTMRGNYVYIDAVIEGHIKAMTRGRDGHRYIVGGENIDFNKFFAIVRKVSGVRNTMFHLPYAMMITTAFLMLTLGKLGLITPKLTPAWVRKYRHHWSLSSSKAVTELGMPLITFEEGVRKTLAWAGHHGNN